MASTTNGADDPVPPHIVLGLAETLRVLEALEDGLDALASPGPLQASKTNSRRSSGCFA